MLLLASHAGAVYDELILRVTLYRQPCEGINWCPIGNDASSNSSCSSSELDLSIRVKIQFVSLAKPFWSVFRAIQCALLLVTTAWEDSTRLYKISIATISNWSQQDGAVVARRAHMTGILR